MILPSNTITDRTENSVEQTPSHVAASVDCLLLCEASFLSDSEDPRPNKVETQQAQVRDCKSKEGE